MIDFTTLSLQQVRNYHKIDCPHLPIEQLARQQRPDQNGGNEMNKRHFERMFVGEDTWAKPRRITRNNIRYEGKSRSGIQISLDGGKMKLDEVIQNCNDELLKSDKFNIQMTALKNDIVHAQDYVFHLRSILDRIDTSDIPGSTDASTAIREELQSLVNGDKKE